MPCSFDGSMKTPRIQLGHIPPGTRGNSLSYFAPSGAMAAAQDRAKRVTAGKRMSKLVGEELEKDQSFWGDKVWDEDGQESEYSDTSGGWNPSACLSST
jgi:hypothetical protein